MKKILLILLLLIIYPLSVGAEDVQSADGSFTWSIPSSLNLSEDVQMDIAIKNIALEENKILDVKVSSANNFKLISESAQEITYELYDDGNTKLSSGDTVLKYQKGTTNKTTNNLTVYNVNIPDDVTTGRFSDNLTFTANVSDDPNYYTITYKLDGGSLEGSYPTMYSSSKGLNSLPTPTKEGYTFAGWSVGIAKGQIVTLSELGLTNVDINNDSITDTFRVLSVDGTNVKLLAMDSYTNAFFNEAGTNTYADSTLDAEMTSYYNALPADVKSAIVEQNINQSTYNYYPMPGSPTVYELHITDLNSEEYYYLNEYTHNVGNRNVFALGIQDIADYLGSDITSAQLNEMFFNSSESIPRYVWLRSAFTMRGNLAFSVSGDIGLVSSNSVNGNQCEVHPAFVVNVPYVTIPAGSTGDKTFTANWRAKSYSISYNLDGGTNNPANPSTYTVEDLPLTLQAPTKDGYAFLGWNDGTNDITSIVIGTIGNKTLTATWKSNHVMPSKGDIITLADMDVLGDGTVDTFRVLSVDGTQVKLLAIDSYKKAYFNTARTNAYSGSTLDTEMTNYYSALPADVKSAIVAQDIVQSVYNESDPMVTSNRSSENPVGSRYVYALDVDDVISYLGDSYTAKPCIALNQMFFGDDAGESVSRDVWLRSALAVDTKVAFFVNGYNGYVNRLYVGGGRYEVRPAFVIDLSQISFAQAESTLSLRNDEPVTQESIININYVTSSGILMIQDQITGNVGETITYYPEEFEGYTTDESIELTFTEDEQSIDVIYTPIEYTINFSEGLEPITYTIESDDIVLPSLEEEGFLGWMNGDVPIEIIEAGSTGSFELTAKVDTETINTNEESSEGAEENSSTQGNETSGTAENNVVLGTEGTNGESENNTTE